MKTIEAAGLVLLATLAGASCGENDVTSPTEVTSPTTITWTTRLVPRGSASRTLTVTQSGTVAVTLQSSPVDVGLGVGVPHASGSGCLTTFSTTTAPGPSPQLTASVEPGTYCVMVFDVVGIEAPIEFVVGVGLP